MITRAAAKKSFVAWLILATVIGCESREKKQVGAQQTAGDSSAAGSKRIENDVANAPGPNNVTVQLSEWKITSTQTEIPKGQVMFAIENKGSLPHVVEISSKKDHFRSMPMQPGEAITMAMELDTGEYKITCPDSTGAHEKRGMQLAFRVRP